jgi:hypothetical protein
MDYLCLRKPDVPKMPLGDWLYEYGLAEYAHARHGDVPAEIVVRLGDLESVTRALAGRLYGAQIVALPHGGPLRDEVWLGPGSGGLP